MKFLIQTIGGKIKHDFSFTLLESIEFQLWLRGGDSIEVLFTDEQTVPDCIPIGNISFVSKYLKDYYGITTKPINIPDDLLTLRYTGRGIINGTEKDIVGKKFVKSNDKIKFYTEICESAPEGNYQISDIIPIDSEWRTFVFKGEMVGLQNYSGRFDVFPDSIRIKEMIAAYINQPIAYTLDVAVSEGETVVIEVHDFYSCGLYGFNDHNILPFMYSRWFNEFINKNKK